MECQVFSMAAGVLCRMFLRHYVLSQSGTNEQIAELGKLLMLYIEQNDKRVNDIIIVLNNLMQKPVETKRIGFYMD